MRKSRPCRPAVERPMSHQWTTWRCIFYFEWIALAHFNIGSFMCFWKWYVRKEIGNQEQRWVDYGIDDQSPLKLLIYNF